MSNIFKFKNSFANTKKTLKYKEYLIIISSLAICLSSQIAVAQTNSINSQVATPTLLPAAEARRNLVLTIRAQAQEVFALSQSKLPAERFPKPSPDFGPDTGDSRRGFGWSVDDKLGGRLLQLSDVHESVVMAFNKAIYGSAAKFMGNEQRPQRDGIPLPFGAWTSNGKHSIVIPVKWLGQPNVEFAQLPPGTDELTHDMLLKDPKSSIGLPFELGELESLGMFLLDDWTSTAIYANLRKSRGISIADESIFSIYLNQGQPQPSPNKEKLQDDRFKCSRTRDVFERKDCLQKLMNDFSEYGQKIIEGKLFNVAAHAPAQWDDIHKRLVIPEINYFLGYDGRRGFCQKNTVCTDAGSYGSGRNSVCYQLNMPLPTSMNVPMTEEQARDYDKRSGGLGKLSVTAVLEVTDPVKLLSSPRMCAADGGVGLNKIVAEGRAVLRQMTIWNDAGSLQAVVFNKAGVSVDVHPLAEIKTLSKVNALSSAGSQSTKPVLETK